MRVKIYKMEAGDTYSDTEGGGLVNTFTGETTYDTDIINQIQSKGEEEITEYNIFDLLPECRTDEGEPLDDKPVVESEL